jgi:hypothetical protein
MNLLTRHLVNRTMIYPAMLIAVAAAGRAESVGVHNFHQAETSLYSTLTTTTDPSAAVPYLSESGFSEGAGLPVQKTTLASGTGLLELTLTGVDGKVLFADSLPNVSPGTADVNSGNQSPELADQVVADASAAVSDTFDPSSSSIATAPATQFSTSGGSVITANSDVPTTAGPEPSTFVLAGAAAIVFGFRKLRRRNA